METTCFKKSANLTKVRIFIMRGDFSKLEYVSVLIIMRWNKWNEWITVATSFLENVEMLTKHEWTMNTTRNTSSNNICVIANEPTYFDNVDGLAGPLAGWAGWAGGACWAWAVWAADQHTIKTIENETFWINNGIWYIISTEINTYQQMTIRISSYAQIPIWIWMHMCKYQ